MEEGIGHAGLRTGRHDRRPVRVERVHEFMGGLNLVLSDPALGYEVHNGEEQERLVRWTMLDDLWVPAPVGP